MMARTRSPRCTTSCSPLRLYHTIVGWRVLHLQLKKVDNAIPFVTCTAAASSSGDKCIGLDWESSSNEEGPYQPGRTVNVSAYFGSADLRARPSGVSTTRAGRSFEHVQRYCETVVSVWSDAASCRARCEGGEAQVHLDDDTEEEARHPGKDQPGDQAHRDSSDSAHRRWSTSPW